MGGGAEKLEEADTEAPLPQPLPSLTTGYARWMGPGEGRLWGDLSGGADISQLERKGEEWARLSPQPPPTTISPGFMPC